MLMLMLFLMLMRLYFVGVDDGESDDNGAAGAQQALLAQFEALGINEA
jgi:hypothetical protein